MDEILEILNQDILENQYLDEIKIDKAIKEAHLNDQEALEIMKKVYSHNLKLIQTELEKLKKIKKYLEKKSLNFFESTTNEINKKENSTKEKPKHVILDKLDVTKHLHYLKHHFMDEIIVYTNKLKTNEINFILIELFKELKLISNLENQNGEYIFEDDKKNLQNLITIIKNRKSFFLENSSGQNVKSSLNHFIFLKNDFGNYIIDQDLKEIPLEFYNNISMLITEMENNKFRNRKRFKNDDKKKYNFSEVRDKSIRIIYKQLNDNIYLIASIFIKKCMINKSYSEHIINISNIFISQKNNILNELDNEHLFKEESNKFEEIKRILRRR